MYDSFMIDKHEVIEEEQSHGNSDPMASPAFINQAKSERLKDFFQNDTSSPPKALQESLDKEWLV